MCGIFAHIGSGSSDLKLATDLIQHRGPDSNGFLTYLRSDGSLHFGEDAFTSEPGPKVQLGFRRLAIIDLNETANQPFSDPNNEIHLIFNGEIYNYLELKNELKQYGYSFNTDSDTEVLLKAYRHWGETCVTHFNGMWAFVLLDTRNNTVFASRDRFGIKPFFYSLQDQKLLFFSELKQIEACGVEKKINQRLIRPYLEQSLLDTNEETFFEGVLRLPAGHSMSVEIDNPSAYRLQPYWTLEERPLKISLEEASQEFLRLFKSSIELRFRSDVPVGICLSGGLDSSSISSTAAKMGHEVATFTSCNGFDQLDETVFVKEVTSQYPQLKPKFYNLTIDEFYQSLDHLLDHQDEPIAGLGVLAQWTVMKLAKQHQIKVLLDGQGGDEILGGYRKFYFFYLKELLKKRSLTRFFSESWHLLTSLDFKAYDLEGIRRYTQSTSISKFLSPLTLGLPQNNEIGLASAKSFKEKSFDDITKFSYPILLRYEDRNSMAFSIESRVPFLDYRLVEFLHGLPSNFIIQNGFTKYILRDSMRGILPEKIRTRKSKLGFATPEDIWIKGSLKQHYQDYFSSMDNPFLNNRKIHQAFNDPDRLSLGTRSFQRLYLFDRWYNKHFS